MVHLCPLRRRASFDFFFVKREDVGFVCAIYTYVFLTWNMDSVDCLGLIYLNSLTATLKVMAIAD